ncbi:PREDICTED: uncharacterized protein LOC104801814 [Tarenaya hassleriana]|uniref:uncharacterized protein LOC104801814 n=1 Tax=Tarenaya hassleriana TaxID=28532 RepID=UPI00053C6623|nr:PREDICTED: uncharacterized protein LOC104801814 [Tarenaya hassleriana]XP_010523481.1 PREDICTED: uncharacterized protein LOC104801814 [Tarenaya hassleriana]XP_010523482.1 PREDICTED: uncharacterized protein LOC104801814 [Tarenaya hassleriana]XP_019056660.1 PREDICTED: uncharacterized protein LOC104801814 [Tarenaya hassleriana]
MATKVQCENLLSGYHFMRDLNEDSSGCSWTFHYVDDKTSGNNGQSCNGFPSRNMADPCFGYEKDVMRRTMLEHEAVFRSQVCQLHRLYRTQRDIMNELKRKESSRDRVPVEASFSLTPLLSQVTYDDARKWKMPDFPVYDRPSMSVVEDNGIGHSPISSRKGSNSQVGSRDVELLEVRPVKVRKKMIDLHLPADEYIDTEETIEFKGNRTGGIPGHLPNGDVKTEFPGDSLRMSADFRRSNGLADLNEPVKAQEPNGFACGYFEGQDLCDGRKILSISSTKEHLSTISLRSDKYESQKVWPSRSLGPGHYSSIHKSIPPFLQPGKALDVDSAHNSREVMGFPHSGPRNVESWRERTFIDLEADTSSHELIHKDRLESSVASNAYHSLQPCNPPSNHFCSSRGNPSFGFPRKAASAQMLPFQNFSDTMSGDDQKQGFLMDRLQSDGNSRFNTGSGNSSWLNQNGFYHESSAPKENQLNFPGIDCNYLNRRSDFSPANVCRDSDDSEMKKEGYPATLPWLSSKPACKSEIVDRQRDPKTGGIPNSLALEDDPRNKLQNHVCSESLKSDPCSNHSGTKKIDASDSSANRKILGRPILDEPCSYGDRLNAGKGKGHNVRMMLDINIPASLSDHEDWKTEDQTGTKISSGFRFFQIDLNVSVSDDDHGSRLDAKVPVIDLEAPPVPESDEDVWEENSSVKPPEETQKQQEDLEKMAADTIVSFSLACDLRDTENEVVACHDSSLEAFENILQWFAETIHAHGERNLDQKLDTSSSSTGEVDYFELMTLKLPEVTEDEYMPKPSVPEDLELVEPSRPASITGQRPRRGNTRRGRQRLDFQRDILPGLTSLSRHEVTEDIQTFDGFMRAMGITWTSSLARRKTGSTRGRKRLVAAANPPSLPPTRNPSTSSIQQHLTNNNNSSNGNMETGLEDRSLGGWGKMTRRPRRQRCCAGNRSYRTFA